MEFRHRYRRGKVPVSASLLEEAPGVRRWQVERFEECCQRGIVEVTLELVQSDVPRAIIIHLALRRQIPTSSRTWSHEA